MHTITITRDYQNSTTTLSTLVVTDENNKKIWEGFGCEPGGPATDASGLNKRILPGEYKLTFTDSARNGSFTKKFGDKWNPSTFFKKYPQYKYSQNITGRNVTLWVVNGTNFDHRRILIHVGNSAKDSRGCYLLGKWRNVSTMTVSNSIVALDELYSLVLKIGPENFKYIIKEEFK